VGENKLKNCKANYRQKALWQDNAWVIAGALELELQLRWIGIGMVWYGNGTGFGHWAITSGQRQFRI